MFESIQNSFNGMFGKVAPGLCRVTMNGGIAVKCDSGKYKTYNVEKGTLTNVTNFSFNFGDEMFFVIPTNKVKPGDIILVEKKPKCVTAVNKKVITVIDYENSEIRQVVPERHIFMGNAFYYGKIVSLLGSFTKGKGMGGLIKMLMMSNLLGGGKSNSMDAGLGGGLGTMLAMSMFAGKDSNPLEGMFDFDLDFDGDDEDEEEEEDDEPVVKKPKKKGKTEKAVEEE